jgi:hypothetical protein
MVAKATPSTAAKAMKASPTTINVWGAVNSSSSRPRAMCQATSL